jgi:hypothetical protein
MSGEQRDNNLGIDPKLRNQDPREYARVLAEKLRELAKGLIVRKPSTMTDKGEEPKDPRIQR